MVFWFHDITTRMNIKWLVKLSIWTHDRMFWELPEKLQLIDGVSVKELRLQRELELANHQSEYWMNYAYELQSELINMTSELEEEPSELELVTSSK
tara:strand:+ start:75 stop:362 length:288 start_codon:yes stop_codon:yes gene_type:complete